MIKGLADLEPRGLTPLAAATNLITAKIVPMAPGLMMKNQRVCVVIATDGQPTDEGFQAALGRLQALPVWVVVRTCTDEDSVIDYYNDLDAEMEAPMEVLDDLLGEAHEVCQLNRWCATLAPRRRPPTNYYPYSSIHGHFRYPRTHPRVLTALARLTYGPPLQTARVSARFQPPPLEYPLRPEPCIYS